VQVAVMFMASPPHVGGQAWLAREVVANRPEAVNRNRLLSTQGSLHERLKSSESGLQVSTLY